MAVSESDPIPIPIPVDLFVSKKHPAYKHGVLCFVDSFNNIIYKINRRSSLQSSSSSNKRVLFDAAGNPLLSIHHNHKGSWSCFKGNGENEELIFRVRRAKNTLTRMELEVFFVAENLEESAPNLQVKGSPCQRNCTVYRGNDIVAQTSLMYKLNQIFVKRGKFRLTVFPGSTDHALIVALIVIFFHG
ncbi:protein LURP-one-related 7 [Morus notabilis]|uniref:protein LURP-one-related 7 n=1 Tax=Morus notabilis TaxID=981085 RepID=UPI000CED5784|nr:protein LURP-one-related 7 [Morus notabilis]